MPINWSAMVSAASIVEGDAPCTALGHCKQNIVVTIISLTNCCHTQNIVTTFYGVSNPFLPTPKMSKNKAEPCKANPKAKTVHTEN